MSWHSERREWNAQGQCARKACRSSFETRHGLRLGRDRRTGLLYCRRCTVRLNRGAPVDQGTPVTLLLDSEAQEAINTMKARVNPSKEA